MFQKILSIPAGVCFGLLAAKVALGDDHLVSEKHNLYKRQNTESKNITFLHINDVHAHLDEYRSSGGFRSPFLITGTEKDYLFSYAIYRQVPTVLAIRQKTITSLAYLASEDMLESSTKPTRSEVVLRVACS